VDTYIYEYVLRIETERYITRIWCEVSQTLRKEMMIKAHRATSEQEGDLDVIKTASALCAEEGVNSVEIYDVLASVGVCVHKNWP
jgi:hypothetical protein